MSWEIREHLKKLLADEEGTAIFPPGLRRPVAFVYPNLYSIGMSNLGVHIFYQIINRRGDSACERFFLPPQLIREMHLKQRTPLLSLETQRPLADFAVIFVMLSYELDYDRLLTLLDLGRIKLRAAERGEREPLVIIGGPCATFNPEPLAAVADAFVIGEGEEIVNKILDCLYAGGSKSEILEQLAQLPGLYVPRFYTPEYAADGSFLALKPQSGKPPLVQRQWLREIDTYPHASAIVTPGTEFAGMYIVEVGRGCGRHCRFCMAGYCFRRPRNRELSSIIADIERRPATTQKVGLMGAAVSDYPEMESLQQYLLAKHIPFNLASLRADTLTPQLVQALALSGQRTLTVAPEAGSKRLRDSINKGITEEHVLRAVDLATAAGIENIKVYYMIGLPHEEDEDIEAMAAMILRLRRKMDAAASRGELTVSVNGFVPKPFTPYQWEPLCKLSILKHRLKILQNAFKRERQIKLISESLRETLTQALLARGDRLMGEALLLAHEGGFALKQALKQQGILAEELTERRLTPGTPLPWSHLEMGFSETYLAAELERSSKQQLTLPCFDGCQRCGVCEPSLVEKRAR